MEIQIDPHTIERAGERGTNEKEIIEVIDTSFPIPAKYGREGKAKIYDFKQKRHNKYYEQKRIEVFYITEGYKGSCNCLCILRKMGGIKMNIFYNDKTDLLYIRLDDRKQDVINRRVSENIVLDIGENERVIGIELLDASKHVNLERLLPVNYEISRLKVKG